MGGHKNSWAKRRQNHGRRQTGIVCRQTYWFSTSFLLLLTFSSFLLQIVQTSWLFPQSANFFFNIVFELNANGTYCRIGRCIHMTTTEYRQVLERHSSFKEDSWLFRSKFDSLRPEPLTPLEFSLASKSLAKLFTNIAHANIFQLTSFVFKTDDMSFNRRFREI